MKKSPSPKRPPGRKGAPLGNTNRLTHGLYSRHLSVHLDHDVSAFPIDQSTDELALARSRLNDLLEKQRDAPPEAWLGFETAVWRYINTIIACTQKNAILGRDQRTSFVTVLEMIRQANEQQAVQ
jgi:hypothetical protein